MSFIFAPFLMLFAAFTGTGNEILDMVDSKIYWNLAGIAHDAEALVPLIADEERPAPDLTKFEALVENLKSPEFIVRQKALAELAKAGNDARPVLEEAAESDDPEVATAAAQILSKLSRGASDSRLHRLMAIRTLGELKSTAAVPHLEKLTTSTEPFIGDYAARSLAQIRGEKYTPKGADPLAYQKDLAITYPSATAVFHVKTQPQQGGSSIREMMAQSMALMAPMMGGGPGMPEMEEILRELTGGIVETFQRIGNIRIDSITGVIPTGVTPASGGFVMIGRGLYDHKRALEFVKEESGGDFKTTTVGDIEWIGDGDDVFLHFASNELIVFIVGDGVDAWVKPVSQRLMGKDKAPAAGPAIALAETVPDNATGFVAAEIPAAMAEGEPAFAILKTVVAYLAPTEDGKLKLDVTLQGTEEEPVAEMFAEMQMGLGMAKGAVEGMAKADKKLAELAEMMNSIKVDRQGAKVTGEATIPDLGSLPIGAVFGMFMGVKMEAAPPEALRLDIAPEIDEIEIDKVREIKPEPGPEPKPEAGFDIESIEQFQKGK